MCSLTNDQWQTVVFVVQTVIMAATFFMTLWFYKKLTANEKKRDDREDAREKRAELATIKALIRERLQNAIKLGALDSVLSSAARDLKNMYPDHALDIFDIYQELYIANPKGLAPISFVSMMSQWKEQTWPTVEEWHERNRSRGIKF